MNIETNTLKQTLEEDYSIFEDDDYVSIFNAIAKQIEEHKIALFTSLFSKWDTTFNDVDFVYDFGSIGCYLKDLEGFLEEKNEDRVFRLDFYEKNRMIEFSFCSRELCFKLIHTNKIDTENLIAEGVLDYQFFRFTILKLRNDFILLLKAYFPVGHKIFLKGNYIV